MNKDELLRTLYNRHAAALSVVAAGDDQRVHIDAARMALALLAQELVDKMQAAVEDKKVDLRTYEWLNDQIARLNDWLAEHEPDLYIEPGTDTAEAMVKAANRLAAQLAQVRTELAAAIDERNFAHKRFAELEADLDNLRDATVESSRDIDEVIAERDALRLQLARLDADNAALIRGNGKSAPAAVLVQAFDNGQANQDYIGLDWSSLSPAAQDYRIGLDHNRWKWRDIPKTIRLELVRCVIRNAGEHSTQAQFDAIRPSWMATATTQCSAFGVQWSVLTDLQHEIEVAL